MMRAKIITITLFINRPGQRVYFQAALPKDTKRIIGLEYGFILTDIGRIEEEVFIFRDPTEIDTSFYVNANTKIGRLTLQTPGMENIIYQSDLFEDNNTRLGENVASLLWQPTPWTHDRKKEEIELGVDSNTTFIEGIFNSYWTMPGYTLHIYLWIEINES